MIDFCLVNMPYASVERPSISLGLLEGYLKKAEIEVFSLYSNIRFIEFIGPLIYHTIEISSNEDLLGEWTFAGVAFPEFETDDDAYFSLFPNDGFDLRESMWKVRRLVPRFIEAEVDLILSQNPRIVGCTSTFQQNCASLSLLRRIKERAPEVITVMGGANCESIMGQTIVNSFPWVDFVVSGEADKILVPFVKLLLENDQLTDPAQLPYGVLVAKDSQIFDPKTFLQGTARALIDNMEEVGIPEYGSYFNALKKSKIQNIITPGLVVETSRGCWWGAKHHCTFCGLNGTGMSYRAKSPERVITEFAQLSAKYGIHKFEVVDNILDMGYLDNLIVRFAEMGSPYSVFFETKANLRKDHIQQLREGGIVWIQPGFESLDDEFLKIIDKGTTAIQNIQTLKWCREVGIRVSWNMLSGAPGESDDWYSKMMDWMPLVSHLQPPQGIIKIRYDRFSPYFDRSEDFGLQLVPCRSYNYVYPLDDEGLKNIAYFFEDQTTSENSYTMQRTSYFELPGQKAVQRYIHQWAQDFWASGWPPMLVMTDMDDSIQIIDTRTVATQRNHVLEGTTADIYRICTKASSRDRILKELQIRFNVDATVESITSSIDDLLSKNLLLHLSNRYFALALEGDVPTLIDNGEFPGGYINIAGFNRAVKIREIWSGSM